MTLSYTLEKIREMVYNFIGHHFDDWEKFKEEHPYTGTDHLSLQSFIGTDMLIDFIFLARQAEMGKPFVNEYWIRSQGTHCVRNEDDANAVRNAFGDIIAKIRVQFDGKEFLEPEWIQDDDCRLKNRFID